MADRNMLELKDIRKTFNPGTVTEKAALCGVNLTLAKGDFITVIGPNGAGKSTLLKIIAGIIKPTEGTVAWSEPSVKGYVPQNFFVNNQLPVKVRDILTLANRQFALPSICSSR